MVTSHPFMKFVRPSPFPFHYFCQIQGAFFNCSHPKISKCQPVSKLRPKKLEYQNCSHPKKNKERKKLKYPNCSHPKKKKKKKKKNPPFPPPKKKKKKKKKS